jgi:hypothetical protein
MSRIRQERQERQDGLKDLWDTVISDERISKKLDEKRLRGYIKSTLSFKFGLEYILKRRISDTKVTYYVFKPISFRLKYVEALTKNIKDLI